MDVAFVFQASITKCLLKQLFSVDIYKKKKEECRFSFFKNIVADVLKIV